MKSRFRIRFFIIFILLISILYLINIDTRKTIPENVIIVQANFAFKELLLNLICSAKAVGIPSSRFLIWALDIETHLEFSKLGIQTYYDPEKYYGVSEATKYHSKEYNKMMRQRSRFWLDLLHGGTSFWWIDADVSLGKSIDTLIDLNSDTDMYIQMDGPYLIQPKEIVQEQLVYKHIPYQKWLEACAGFFYVKANERTINFFTALDDTLFDHAEWEDQEAMNVLLQNKNISHLVIDDVKTDNVMRYEFFNQQDVTSGHVFCLTVPYGYWPPNTIKDPTAFHMNCVTAERKEAKFNELGLWYVKDGTCQ
jgi:hypothetical protein